MSGPHVLLLRNLLVGTLTRFASPSALRRSGVTTASDLEDSRSSDPTSVFSGCWHAAISTSCGSGSRVATGSTTTCFIGSVEATVSTSCGSGSQVATGSTTTCFIGSVEATVSTSCGSGSRVATDSTTTCFIVSVEATVSTSCGSGLSSCHGLHNNLLHCLSRSYGLHKLHFWLSSCHGLHNNLLHCLSRSFSLHKLLLAPCVLHNLLLGHHSIRPIAKACRRTCSRWRIFYLSCKARGAAGEPQEIASGSSSRTTTTSTSNFRQKANETNGTKKRERKNKRQRDQGRGQWRTHPCPRTPP